MVKRLLNEWIILGLAVSTLGGIARAIHCDRYNFSWLCFFYRIVAASFVSMIVGFIMIHADYPPAIEAAIIGSSGYAAVDILKCVPGVVKRKADKL